MNIQINPSDMPANQISLNDKIKQILSAKLTPSQIEAGYVCTKELTYIKLYRKNFIPLETTEKERK